MSSNVEERVVEMVFDNKKFEKNAKETQQTLEALDKSLDLKGSTKGFKDLEKAAKNVDLSSISDAVDAVNNKFSIMGTIGDQILRNLTSRAVDFGINWAKSMTLDQVNSGWKKYEAKTQAVQVMLGAMKEFGVTIDDVDKVLGELNTYTDNTSYHFDQMVDSMSKFTASGVGMEDAEKMVEGIANWAAKSGVSADRAGMAFYNLSQAVGSGALKVQDWKSIENLNMNTKEFEETAIEVAQRMIDEGRASKEMAAAFKKANPQVEGFRDSLSTGWLDKDVMTELFKEYADQTTDFGYSAYMAAYEAKSLTDAVEAAKEAVASGWANIFEQIFGNYEEARVFWTEVADAMIEVFSAPTNALAELLTEWHQHGGYVAFIESIRNAWESVVNIGNLVKEVFSNIFPEYSFWQLVDVTRNLEKLTDSWALNTRKIDIDSMILSPKDIAKIEQAGGDLTEYYENIEKARKHNEKVDKNLEDFRETLEGIFSIINFLRVTTGSLFKIVLPFTKLLIPITKIIGTITSALGRLATSLVDRILNSQRFNDFIERLTAGAEAAAEKIAAFADKIDAFLDEFLHSEFFTEFVDNVIALWDTLKQMASPYVTKAKEALGEFVENAKQFIAAHTPGAIKAIGDALEWFIGIAGQFATKVGAWLVPTLKQLWENLKILWGWLKNIGGNLKKIWEEQIVPSKTYQAIKQKIDNLIAKIKTFATKFIDILKNGGIKAAFDWLKEQFDSLVEKIKKWDIGKVLKNALEAGILLKIISAVLTFRKITKTLKYLRSFLVGFPNALKAFSKGLLLKRAAASILMLAGALWILAQIPPERLNEVMNAMLKLGIGLVAATLLMAVAMKLLNKGEKFKEAFGFSKAVSGLIALAASVLILSVALKVISSIPEKQLTKSVIALAEVLAAITLASIIMSAGGKTMLNAGVGLLAFVAALLLLSVAFERIKAVITELMSGSNTADLVSLGIVLGAIVAVMFVLSKIFAGADKETWKLSAVIISFGAAMLLIAFAVERIAKLKGADFAKAAGVLAALIIIVALLTSASKGVSVDSSKKVLSMAAAILAIGLAVNGIAAALIILSLIPKEMMLKGLLRLIAVTVLMNTMLKAAGKIQPKSAGGILAMAAMLGTVVAALWFLQSLNLERVLASAIILGAILFTLGVSMRTATRFSNGEKTWMSLAAMALIVTVIGQSLIGLSRLNFSNKVLGSAVALGSVLLALAISMRIAGKAANQEFAWKSLIVMAGMVVAVAVALAIVASLPLAKMLWSASTLVALILILGVVTKSINKAFSGTKDLKGALASFITMFALVGFVVGALWAINSLGMSIGQLVATALALGSLMLVMTLCVSAITRLPKIPSLGQSGLIAVMFAAIIFPIVAALAWAKSIIKDPSGLVSIAGSIALIVLSMTAPVAACVALGKVTGAAGAAIKGAVGFGIALAAIMAVVIGIGYLVEALGSENLQGKVESAGQIMEAVAEAIGGLLGGLIVGVGDAVFSSLETWGGNIKKFCEDVSGGLAAFDGVSVNNDAIAAIGALAGAILEITAAAVIEGLTNFLTFGAVADPMAEFARDLLVIAPALALFSSMTSGIDASHTTEVGKAISALGAAADSVGYIDPEWLQSLKGRPKTLGEFATELIQALPGIMLFMTFASKLGDKATATKDVAGAIGSIIDVANKLPRKGGILQDVIGEIQPLNDFADTLAQSTTGIEAFAAMSTRISGNVKDMTPVTEAIGQIIDVANALKPLHVSYGWGAVVEDAQSLKDFMEAFGGASSISGNIFGSEFSIETGKDGLTQQISSFATEMKRLKDEGTLDGLDDAIEIIGKLGTVGSEIVATQETITTIWGTTKEKTDVTLLQMLSETLGSLGTAMNDFATKAGASNIGDFAAAEGLHSIIQTLVDFRKLSMELDPTQAGSVDLLRGVVDSVADTIKYVISALSRVNDELAAEGISGDLSAFDAVFSLFNAFGQQGLSAELIEGFNNSLIEAQKLQDTATAFEMTSGLTDELSNKTTIQKFKDAGGACVQGFADGIKSNINIVVTQADSLSTATINAMRRALRIQSPSRVMRQLGDYTGEGYYLGLEDWVDSSAKAGEDLAQGVTQAALSTLGYISSLMNGDLSVDMTIRPVLDLTNMQSGMNELDAMFSRRQAVMANIDADSLSTSDEVAELVNVSWQILREIQNGRDLYLDGKVLAGSMNRRLGRAVDMAPITEGGV